MVGTGRFELPTCRLGGDRINLLNRAQRLSLCAPRAVAALPVAGWDGRDGQIRTADLSLRRRPLYPSELRPRVYPHTILPALQPFPSDVRAIVHAFEMNVPNLLVRVADRLGQARATRRYS
jgi:hypothetical protein